jgi:two-component system sensor histidine kinase BaeS
VDRNGTRLGVPIFRKKELNRLFITLLLASVASLVLFFGILTVSFFFGYRRSSRGWGDERQRAIEELVSEKLKELLPQIGSVKNLDSASLMDLELGRVLPGALSLAVYDSDKKLLYLHRGHHGMMRGKSRGKDPEEYESSREFEPSLESEPSGKLRFSPSSALPGDSKDPLQSGIPLRSLKLDGQTIGYYQIGPITFGTDRANMTFLRRMRTILLFGTLSAFAVASLLSFLLSRRIAGSAKRVASGIDRIAQGELSLRIPEKGSAEIAIIAASANKLASTLKREEELRRQWAEDVAHDLRTPIAALKAQLEGMSDGVLDITAERISRNVKELQRIESLVDNLAELTRLESPEMRITPGQIETERFFRELENRFSPFFQVRHLSVRWNALTPHISGDEQLLLRALSNFISNAIRHTPEGGEITITARDEGKMYSFHVHNTGKGISEAEIGKVFDRLYRGERSRQSPGSGLGLTIAQKIAELHGGGITIQSTEGEGTTVQMHIRG